jgi:uncharacterized protein
MHAAGSGQTRWYTGQRGRAAVNARIIVFARAPVPGRVKTRLQLDPAAAARLHDAFVRDTLEMLAPFPDVELSTDAATHAWDEYAVARSLQSPGDLGARLYAALEGALGRGCRCALVLGSDSPSLPPGHIRALLSSAADVAIGPTEDGGFYAIACRRIVPGMFQGVEWSSARTLEYTVRTLTAAGLSVALGPPWFDIDEPGDLHKLAQSPGAARHSRAACSGPA